MLSLVILGTGNVATHLAKVFFKTKNLQLKQVYNHRSNSLKDFEKYCPVTTNLDQLEEADVYLIAVKDDKIKALAARLNIGKALVLHTSGSVGMNALRNHQNHGVFYPLQTFSKKRSVNFAEIPLCVEANSKENLGKTEKIAREISGKIFKINSEQRRSLHVAAVFVNNFTNHLYQIGAEICEENNVAFEILQPLIKETAAKIETLNPKQAQTGPALRKDKQSISNHLQMLSPEKQEIYKLLTASIKNTHGKKL